MLFRIKYTDNFSQLTRFIIFAETQSFEKENPHQNRFPASWRRRKSIGDFSKKLTQRQIRNRPFIEFTFGEVSERSSELGQYFILE